MVLRRLWVLKTIHCQNSRWSNVFLSKTRYSMTSLCVRSRRLFISLLPAVTSQTRNFVQVLRAQSHGSWRRVALHQRECLMLYMHTNVSPSWLVLFVGKIVAIYKKNDMFILHTLQKLLKNYSMKLISSYFLWYFCDQQ